MEQNEVSNIVLISIREKLEEEILEHNFFEKIYDHWLGIFTSVYEEVYTSVIRQIYKDFEKS